MAVARSRARIVVVVAEIPTLVVVDVAVAVVVDSVALLAASGFSRIGPDGQVFVCEIDSVVEDGDDHSAALRDVPALRCIDVGVDDGSILPGVVQVPLVRILGVVGGQLPLGRYDQVGLRPLDRGHRADGPGGGEDLARVCGRRPDRELELARRAAKRAVQEEGPGALDLGDHLGGGCRGGQSDDDARGDSDVSDALFAREHWRDESLRGHRADAVENRAGVHALLDAKAGPVSERRGVDQLGFAAEALLDARCAGRCPPARSVSDEDVAALLSKERDTAPALVEVEVCSGLPRALRHVALGRDGGRGGRPAQLRAEDVRIAILREDGERRRECQAQHEQ